MDFRPLLAPIVLSAMLLAGSVHAEKPMTEGSVKTEQQKYPKADKPRLSDEKFKSYKDAMNKARYDGRAIGEQIKTKRKELGGLLSAEKFDKLAYLAKHDEVQALINKTARLKAEAMANVAEKFNVADRKILAERLEGKPGGHRKNQKSKKRVEPIKP